MNPITAGDPGDSQGIRVTPMVGEVNTSEVSLTCGGEEREGEGTQDI